MKSEMNDSSLCLSGGILSPCGQNERENVQIFALRNHNYRGNLSLLLTFLSRPGGDVASVTAAQGRLKRKTVEMRKRFIHSFKRPNDFPGAETVTEASMS